MTLPNRFALAFAVLLMLTSAALAKDGRGTKVVREANATIAGLLEQEAAPGSSAEKKLAAAVTASIRDFLDIDELGTRALSGHWDAMSPAERSEYLTLLRALIEESYIKGLRANLTFDVVYQSETTDPKGAVLVTTQIKTQRKGRPYTIEVVYVLTLRDGKLRCFDVRTDGIGLVENYRSMFSKIIAKEGLAGLIARMKKKQAGG
jgi:ABC-type transporter MlaC component